MRFARHHTEGPNACARHGLQGQLGRLRQGPGTRGERDRQHPHIAGRKVRRVRREGQLEIADGRARRLARQRHDIVGKGGHLRPLREGLRKGLEAEPLHARHLRRHAGHGDGRQTRRVFALAPTEDRQTLAVTFRPRLRIGVARRPLRDAKGRDLLVRVRHKGQREVILLPHVNRRRRVHPPRHRLQRRLRHRTHNYKGKE